MTHACARAREAALMDFEVALLESGALVCFVQLGWCAQTLS